MLSRLQWPCLRQILQRAEGKTTKDLYKKPFQSIVLESEFPNKNEISINKIHNRSIELQAEDGKLSCYSVLTCFDCGRW